MTPELEDQLGKLATALSEKLSEKTESDPAKMRWDRAKVIANWVAVIAVPVVLAAAGYFVNLTLKTRETEAKMVELAIEILRAPPTESPDDLRIREWGIDIIEQYSDVPLPTETRQALEKAPIPTVELSNRLYQGIEGFDDRVTIDQDTALDSPWNNIVVLKLVADGVVMHSTGFLIDERTIITTGHAIYWRDQFVTSVTVSLGSTEYNLSSSDLAVSEGFKAGNSDLDYGIIQLPDGRHGVNPVFGFSSLPDNELAVASLRLGGFADGSRLIRSDGGVLSLTTQAVLHNIDSGRGTSGSPIWLRQQDSYSIVGIHIGAGYGGKRAVRVTNALIDDIEAMKNSLE